VSSCFLTTFDAALIDICSRKSFNEPAKLAGRVVAPGDGEAEPGVTAINFREPAKLATDAGGSILQ